MLAAYESAWWRMISHINFSFIPFKEGDLVWLNAKNFSMQNSEKIAAEQEDLFEITENILAVTYWLQLPVI